MHVPSSTPWPKLGDRSPTCPAAGSPAAAGPTPPAHRDPSRHWPTGSGQIPLAAAQGHARAPPQAHQAAGRHLCVGRWFAVAARFLVRHTHTNLVKTYSCSKTTDPSASNCHRPAGASSAAGPHNQWTAAMWSAEVCRRLYHGERGICGNDEVAMGPVGRSLALYAV